ncbi:DUF2796 domain-containing protein [Methylibium sp. T29]|uniref:DUF2796 domain-containing protein n=1 Tax=Methylibium sp. T29 TaxID=1430884 RepID=UPI0003F40E88|nr:DUF2796 domain-containing protein [Methylibium sp. T29]EWS55460.1 hypothetical protein X551_01712 [Methylibium sp. T29]
MMTKRSVRRTAGVCLALGTALAHAHGTAHQHGVAKLDVAVESNRVTFELDTPLDNLIGIERAPRNDAERKRADAAVATLRDAAKLFGFDPAAQCRQQDVELTAPVLGLGAAAAPSEQGEHADLEGRFVFACADTARASQVDIGLFKAFPKLQQLDVQVAGPHGQSRQTLKRPANKLTLVK